MTFTVFVGMVGGAGTTSAAFTYALAAHQRGGHVAYVDLTGDVTAVAGLPTYPTDGLTDALAATGGQLRPRVDDPFDIYTLGSARRWPEDRVDDLVDRLSVYAEVVVDAGRHGPEFPSAMTHLRRRFYNEVTQLVAVMRGPSYQSLSNYKLFVADVETPDAVLLHREDRRALLDKDVSAVIDAPLVAVDVSAAVARTIDAGLLQYQRALPAWTSFFETPPAV